MVTAPKDYSLPQYIFKRARFSVFNDDAFHPSTYTKVIQGIVEPYTEHGFEAQRDYELSYIADEYPNYRIESIQVIGDPGTFEVFVTLVRNY